MSVNEVKKLYEKRLKTNLEFSIKPHSFKCFLYRAKSGGCLKCKSEQACFMYICRVNALYLCMLQNKTNTKEEIEALFKTFETEW